MFSVGWHPARGWSAILIEPDGAVYNGTAPSPSEAIEAAFVHREFFPRKKPSLDLSDLLPKGLR